MTTTLSTGARRQIINILREQGYPRYAKLVSLFDIYLTDDSEVVGYMIPGKAKIVLNEGLSIYQVSVIVRHEILHEFFTHHDRKLLFDNSHIDLGSNHELANVAADFDISNKAYTTDDKANARNIKLNGKLLRGLVTEDHFPEWKGLSFEEMYERLLREKQQTENKLQELVDHMSQLSKKELEDLEDLLDKMEDATSDNSTEKQSSSTSENGQIADFQSELDKIKDEITASDDTTGDRKGKEFDLPEDQRNKVDIAARVKQIKVELSSMDAYEEVMAETNNAIRKDAVAKVKRNHVSNYAKGSNGGLREFKLNLQKFIASQISSERERTWERPDSRYKRRGFLVQGSTTKQMETIPVINVYWDTSGSFSNPSKTAAARAAIDSIQQYVKKGLIDVMVYYHSDDVYDHPVSGGNNGNNVVAHIKTTKPDNVIIITDEDLSDTTSSVTVPGAVWILFYDSKADRLIQNVRGRKRTKWYMVEYRPI